MRFRGFGFPAVPGLRLWKAPLATSAHSCFYRASTRNCRVPQEVCTTAAAEVEVCCGESLYWLLFTLKSDSEKSRWAAIIVHGASQGIGVASESQLCHDHRTIGFAHWQHVSLRFWVWGFLCVLWSWSFMFPEIISKTKYLSEFYLTILNESIFWSHLTSDVSNKVALVPQKWACFFGFVPL